MTKCRDWRSLRAEEGQHLRIFVTKWRPSAQRFRSEPVPRKIVQSVNDQPQKDFQKLQLIGLERKSGARMPAQELSN
jgi:hypothetical protein